MDILPLSLLPPKSMRALLVPPMWKKQNNLYYWHCSIDIVAAVDSSTIIQIARKKEDFFKYQMNLFQGQDYPKITQAPKINQFAFYMQETGRD